MQFQIIFATKKTGAAEQEKDLIVNAFNGLLFHCECFS